MARYEIHILVLWLAVRRKKEEKVWNCSLAQFKLQWFQSRKLSSMLIVKLDVLIHPDSIYKYSKKSKTFYKKTKIVSSRTRSKNSRLSTYIVLSALQSPKKAKWAVYSTVIITDTSTGWRIAGEFNWQINRLSIQFTWVTMLISKNVYHTLRPLSLRMRSVSLSISCRHKSKK